MTNRKSNIGSRIYKLSDSEFIDLCKRCRSYSEILRNLGLSCKGSTYRIILVKRMSELSLTYDDLSKEKRVSSSSRRMSDADVFCENSEMCSNHGLKTRYLRLRTSPYVCDVCGISEWRGLPLSLHLDHINGNHRDNRLENLRLICPNCDSQQITYRGRHERVKFTRSQNTCSLCGIKISYGSTYCRKCASRIHATNCRKFTIDRDELKRLIRTTPFTTIAKQYGVTDNAIRKRCKFFNLPYKSSEIKKISEEDWETI